MLRTSTYVVLVAIPGDRTRFLVHHGIRGGCDLVSDHEAAYLSASATVARDAPLHGEWLSEPLHRAGDPVAAPAQSRVAMLTKRGYLTSWTEAEEEAVYMLAVRRVHQRSLAAAMGYNFLVSYDRSSSAHAAPVAERRHLTLCPEVIDRICESLAEFETRLDVKLGAEAPRRIGIVGGASLRAANRRIVDRLIECVLALGTAQIWAESTGHEVEAFADAIGSGGISRISLNWTDRTEGTDAGADDGASVRALGQTIRLVLDRGASVLLKLPGTPQVMRTLPKIGELIAAEGWADEPRFQIQLLAGEEPQHSFEEESVPENQPADQRPAGPGALHPVLQRLTQAAPVRIRPARSILTEELDVVTKLISDHRFHAYVFDPQGHVYLSTKEAGDPRLRIGELQEHDGIAGICFVGSASLAPMSPRSAVHRAAAPCRRCPYGVHCGWGQEVRGLLGTRAQGGNACDAFGAHFRSAVADLSELSPLP